ncbi:hypothetical protein JCM6882_009229 [Rhodosporidiobolus microsporus]
MLLSRLPRLSSPVSSSLFSAASTARRAMSTSPSLRRPVQLLAPQELAKLLQQEGAGASSGKERGDDVVVLDASWFMPNLQPPRDPWAEFRKKRIEGAGFWHLDQISSTSDVGVPHNVPSKEHFEDACSRLGISRGSHVVFYDSQGVFSSPRAAFTFKHFSHPLVSILDGGLPRWIAEGLPTSSTSPSNPNPHEALLPGQQKARYQPIFSELLYAVKPRVESYFIADIEELFTEYRVGEGEERRDTRGWEEVRANAERGEGEGDAVLDARPAGRFHGTDPEPRAGLSSGHIPHSLSLPFPAVLSEPSNTDPSYKTVKSPEELQGVFEKALGREEWEKVKGGERGVVTTCGSGMTAAILWLALQRAGVSEKVGLYDESWTGYASRPESKIVKS